ncbi:MAG: hypothetical protein PVI30_21205, partial [Myxococcales bacterium]
MVRWRWLVPALALGVAACGSDDSSGDQQVGAPGDGSGFGDGTTVVAPGPNTGDGTTATPGTSGVAGAGAAG